MEIAMNRALRNSQTLLDGIAASAVAGAALLVRGLPVASANFPLNDGGLFYVMARNVQLAGMQMPPTTSYNNALIPFVYPPLGIYFAALINVILPVGLFDLLRVIPLVFCFLSVPAVYLAAKEVLASRLHALIAAAAFAVVPQAYEWLIEGGGLTRAPGLVFSLLAVAFTVRAMRDGSTRQILSAGVAGGLAVMSHPDAALFTFLSVLLLALRRPTRDALLRGAGSLLAMGFVSSPWWTNALARVGPRGLLSAASLHGPLGTIVAGMDQLISFSFTGELLFPFIGTAALLGFLWCAARRAWLLPSWLASSALLGLSAWFTAIPLSMLASIGIVDVVFRAVSGVRAPTDDRALLPLVVWRVRSARWILIVGLSVTTISALEFNALPISPDRAISHAERTAAFWVRDHTPAGATFAVVTGDSSGTEGEQEWFPALSMRTSVATPQGMEWLGAAVWGRAYSANIDLQACARETAGCLESWTTVHDVALQYVFIPKGQLRGAGSSTDCCRILRASLEINPDFADIYDGLGASIFLYKRYSGVSIDRQDATDVLPPLRRYPCAGAT